MSIADCRALGCYSYPTSLLVLAEPVLLLCLRFTLVLCCWLVGCLAARTAPSRGAETTSSREAPAAWTGPATDMCLPSPWDDVPLGRRTRVLEWLDPGAVSPDGPEDAPSSGPLGEWPWLRTRDCCWSQTARPAPAPSFLPPVVSFWLSPIRTSATVKTIKTANPARSILGIQTFETTA